MSNTYKIGQVLYIIAQGSVTPVQIQEINKRTTIEGEETQFMVMDSDGNGPYNLEEINAKICTNSKDVEKFLKDNANRAIDSMVQNAVSIAEESFGNAGGGNTFPTQSGSKSQKGKVETTKPPSPPKKVAGEMEVEVVGKDGKTRVQKTKIRSVSMPEQVA